MKFIKYENIFGDGAINVSYIVELRVEAAFIDGEILKNTWGVVAQLPYGQGSRIIFVGNDRECQNYIDELIKGVTQ